MIRQYPFRTWHFGSRARGLTAMAASFAVGLIFPIFARAEMPAAERAEVLIQALAYFDRGTEFAREQPDKAAEEYRKAQENFERLVHDGVHNGKLYYNLANTYLQLGKVGESILYYRRAEKLIGADPQLQANLRFARTLCRNQIPRSGQSELLRTVFFWHFESSIHARYGVALAAYALFWGLLAVRAFVPRPGMGYAALAMLVVWLSAGASVAVESVREATVREGVTVQSDITVRKGSGEGYDPQFQEPLHEGVEFTVLDERPEWYKIELSDGSSGWIRMSAAQII